LKFPGKESLDRQTCRVGAFGQGVSGEWATSPCGADTSPAWIFNVSSMIHEVRKWVDTPSDTTITNVLRLVG